LFISGIDCFIKGISTVSEDSVIYTERLREIDGSINNIKGLRLFLNLILTSPSSWMFLVMDSVDIKILVFCWIADCSGDSKALTVIRYTAIGCSN
jgi:hypothetical protein